MRQAFAETVMQFGADEGEGDRRNTLHGLPEKDLRRSELIALVHESRQPPSQLERYRCSRARKLRIPNSRQLLPGLKEEQMGKYSMSTFMSAAGVKSFIATSKSKMKSSKLKNQFYHHTKRC